MASKTKGTDSEEHGKRKGRSIVPLAASMIDWSAEPEGDAPPFIQFPRGFYKLLEIAELTPEGREAALLLFDVLFDGLVNGDAKAIRRAAAQLVDRGDCRRRVGPAGPGAWIEMLIARLPEIQAAEQGVRGLLIMWLHVELCRFDDRARALRAIETSELIERELPRGAPLTKKVLLNIASELVVRCEAFDHTDAKKARDMFRKVRPVVDFGK